MLTHAQVWSAIDRLAARAGLSASGLARRAGLDPTTFNKSKRITAQGRARWPSTESIAKALTATATPIDAFLELINPSGTAATRAVPLIGFAEAGAGGYFDDAGFPVGEGWDEIAFPAVSDEHAYALEVSGHSMEPAYRDGDVILRIAGGADPPRRPRRGQDTKRRGAGERTQAADGKIDRAALAQYRARGSHAGGERDALDRAHPVGEPIGFSAPRHCEERSDEAIHDAAPQPGWIASLRSQ